MARHEVCALADLPPGARREITVGGRSIGVFNVDGRCFAVRNVCPHKGAPLCRGTVGGTMLPSDPHRYEYGLPGQVLRCPWHGWEFNMETGRSLFDPGRRVRTYPVVVQDGTVFVDV